MLDTAFKLVALLKESGQKLALAESCTGGLIAAAVTDVPGASDIFDRGFVTYSNEAKQGCLNVNENILSLYGAVSEQTALEMARGTLENSRADIALSVTGIAGPGGGTPEKPVGLVCFGLASKKPLKEIAVSFKFKGNRQKIRESSCLKGLEILLEHLTEQPKDQLT